MIKNVIIKNYRSLGVSSGSLPHEFELSPLTVIVGDNSSGKSNILRALSFATTPKIDNIKRTDFFIRISSDKPRKSGTIEIELTSEIQGTEHTIICKSEGTDIRGFTKKFTIDGIEYPEISSTSPPSEELIHAIEPHEIFITPTVRDIDYLNSAKELLPLATRSTISATSKALRKELSRKLENICEKLKLPLGVNQVQVTPLLNIEELMSIIKLGFEVDDTIQIPVQNLGQGHISRGILKLAELQGAQKTICIEEPEIHVHPTGIKSLLKTFDEATQTKNRQILVTTHSQEVINAVNFSNLLTVKKENQRSIIKNIDPDKIGIKNSSAERIEHNILRKGQRGDIFLSKFILLVEGEYDRMVLELIDREGKLGLLDKDIRIIEMGSISEFPKYFSLFRELDRPFATLIDDSAVFEKDNSTKFGIKAGLIFNTILKDSALRRFWPEGNTKKYYESKPSSRRTLVKNTWAHTKQKGIIILAHGGHDIKDLIRECWNNVKSPNERKETYKALGGKNPRPTNDDIDNLVNKALNKKAFDMLKVVASLPVERFDRLSKHIISGIKVLTN